MNLLSAAAGVPPAVEGGVPPPGNPTGSWAQSKSRFSVGPPANRRSSRGRRNRGLPDAEPAARQGAQCSPHPGPPPPDGLRRSSSHVSEAPPCSPRTFPPAASRPVDFVADIQPPLRGALRQAATARTKQKSGYRLDVREVALRKAATPAIRAIRPRRRREEPVACALGGRARSQTSSMPPKGPRLTSTRRSVCSAPGSTKVRRHGPTALRPKSTSRRPGLVVT
jgi:hypothetical protein